MTWQFRSEGIKSLLLLLMLVAGIGEAEAQEPDGVQTVEAGKPYRIRTTMIEGMQLSTKENTVRNTTPAIGIFMTDYFAKDQIFYFEATSTNYFIKDAEGKYVNSDGFKTYAGNFVDNNNHKYAIEPVDGTDYVKFKCAGSNYLAPGRGFVNGSPVYGDGDKDRHNTNTKTIVLWKIIPWDPVADLKVLIDAVATYKDNDATLSTAYDAAVATYESYKTTSITDMLDNTGGVLTAVANGISALTTARDNYLQSIPKPTPGECYIAWSHDTGKLLTRPANNTNATLTPAISANNKMTLESDGTNYYIKNGDYYLAVKGTRAVTYGTNYDTDANVLTTEWKNTKDEACQLNLIPYGNGHFGIQFKKFDNYSTTSSTGGYLDPGPCTDLNTLYPLRESGISTPMSYWVFLPLPVITYDENTNQFSISCATTVDDYKIYYTTDGSVPTTQSDEYTASFSAEGISVVKAIAVCNGAATPVVELYSPNVSLLIQHQSNTDFYMVPGADNGDDKNVITTSLMQPMMGWNLKAAENVVGTQYYYFYNTSSDTYLFCNSSGTVLVKSSSSFDSTSDNFKFSLLANDDGIFRILPKARSGYWLNKGDNNSDNNNVSTVNNNPTQNQNLWKIIVKSQLPAQTPPFTVSTDDSQTYYKLKSADATTYFIIPPTGASGNAQYVNTAEGDTPNMLWIIKEAGSDDWLTYYHFINATTGEYLYYRADITGDNQTNAFITKPLSESTPETADRYQFAVANTTQSTSDSYYYVIPKPIKYLNSRNKYNLVWRENATNPLKTTQNRGGTNVKWIFDESSITVAPPIINYDAATNQIVLSCLTPDVTIYYTTDGTEATTSSETYAVIAGNETHSFLLPAGITTVRAIAVKSGTNSPECTCTIPFQTTVGANERPYLIQNDNNKWSDGTIIYYMIPDAPNGNVNTTNVPRPTMEWLFTNATTEAGTTYYSILNKATEKYIYWDGTNIVLKDKSEYSDSDNGFKFNIIENNSGFNINPYGVSSGNMYVHKSSNNNSANALVLNNARTGNSLWYFVQRSALDLTAPFTAASESSVTYYKLRCVGDNTLYITPPTTGSNVVMSTTTDNTVDWYFEEAQTATNEDWNTYYYIRHAATGKYLYYTGTTTINNNQCFELRSSVDDTEKSRYMYTWVRYYNGVGQYQIVPHFLLNVSQDYTSVIRRDGNQLKAGTTRSNHSSAWTFEPSTMSVAPPHISYDAVNNKIVISTTTPGATIRYMTGDDSCDDPTSSSGTVYAGGSTGFELSDNVNVIKAIAIKDDNPSSVTTYQVVVHASVGEAKRPYLLQSVECTDFYLLPGDKDNSDIYRITTSSLRRPSMQWYFVAAGAPENGYQYYYLINESGKYAAYYKNTSNQDVLCMHDAATFYAAADTEKSKYKFRIGYYDDATAPGYYIRPMDITYEGGLHKGNGNNASNTCWIAGSNDVKTRWNIIPLSKKPAESAPFTVSDATTTAYYKIGNVNASEYFIIPKTLSTTYATTSNEDVDDAKWYFTEAGHDEWVTYYNIVNAVTGEYLYFSGAIQTGTNNNAFVVQSGGTDDRYQFAVARTTESATLGKYYIVPKVLKDLTTNSYVLIWRDGTNPLKTQAQRDNDQRKWTFTSTAFKCATPVFVYDDVQQRFSITCATPGAKIYYKGYNEGDEVPTITIPDNDATLYTRPFDKGEFDNYVAVAARSIDDGSDQSEPGYGNTESLKYRYHIIDKSHREVIAVGSNDETLGLPVAYQSPLVTHYHYHTADNFNMATGSEMTSLSDLGEGEKDIYVTYDVSPRIKLDGSQYYMLRYENPKGIEIYEEVGDLPQGFPANQKNVVHYPYTNGKEGFNLYGDEKKDAIFGDGESTRTRFLWYFVGGDPYRIRIHAENKASKYHSAEAADIQSYFYTFYGNGGSTTSGHTTSAVHTVLTQPDRIKEVEGVEVSHQPTEYMILNGHGGSSFPYRLMTTEAVAITPTTSRHLEVSSFDHQWLDGKKSAAEALSGSRTADWYHMPDLEKTFYKPEGGTIHADHQNLWYETVDMGTDFQIEPVTLYPVLHLVDNHGWEIAHWTMENTTESKNKIKQFNSPLVKEYRWYKGESNTGLNKPIVKVTGYYKYYINPLQSGSTPVATTADLTSDWSFVNFENVAENYNFYVFYDALDNYTNDNRYLVELNGKLAEASGTSIGYTKNGEDYHASGVLKENVPLTDAIQWKIAPNPDIDTENAYDKYSGLKPENNPYNYDTDATNTSQGRPEPGKDAGRFDPYSLRIETSVGSNYYTVNSSYAISLTDGAATQFTYTDRADLSRDNRGTTFMAVQGTDDKMRLVLRNSDRAENLTRALDTDGTASMTAATTISRQTAVLVPLRQNVYTIVRSDGTRVISSTGYTNTLKVPDDIASPLLDETYYSFYPTLEDAINKTNPLDNTSFASKYAAPVFVRYDEKTYGNSPIDLSGTTTYTMRNNGQYLYYETESPAFTTATPTDEELGGTKYMWKFSGNDPYKVTIQRGDYQLSGTFIWLGNSTYGWNLLANTPAVDGKYAYLYNDGEGHALQHREALGKTTAGDNFFVEQYSLQSYTYHIINRAGTEAIKYTIEQRDVTPLNYDNLPAAIRSPYIADETLTFYSDAECNTVITTAGQATSSDNDIYVKYTVNQLTGKRLDLKGESSYKMRVGGSYVYDNSGALAIGTGTETEYWLLTGNDPYAVEIKSQTGNHTISYDTSGPSLSIDGSDSKFILLNGNAGTYVELMAATGADTETYYHLGLVSNSPALCSSSDYQHGNDALQVNFSKVIDSGTGKTVLEIAYSSDMKANPAGRYKAVAGFVIDETINNFTGEFDGDFQEISLTSIPLFDTVDGAIIKNVIFGSVSISGGDNVGAIANVATGSEDKITSIYNCGILAGSVSGSGNVGGLVGCLGSKTDDAKCYARVINCYSYADVTSGSSDNAYAAGIVGYNSFASTNANLRTMVMNCMFYGNVTDGKNISPVYGGQIINNNSATGLNNFNYFSADDFKDFSTRVTAFNCALGAEKRFLTRFEFYRQILNSNLPLAAWYATGNTEDYAIKMAKWVLESADRTISNPKPYPDLRRHGERALYPSIVNIDAAHAGAAGDRNKGGRLGTLNVTISGTGSGAPAGAEIITSSLSLNITDKDEDRFNFNYYKVQLPYYNQVGTGNYTYNKVVTGWEITSITGGTAGNYSTGNDVELDSNGNVTATPYNFADRDCTAKDLYEETGRVFAQGAYFDVPNGVTAITIRPHWATCVYLSDGYYDKTYTSSFGGGTDNPGGSDISLMGQRFENGQSYDITGNGSSQAVYTTMSNAIKALSRSSKSSVYDYAVVLVGNYHHYYKDNSIKDDNDGFTIMSADFDLDNEPDNCFFYQHEQRRNISPVRFDFLCWPGIGMAQKPSDSNRLSSIGIFNPRGWFEVTNTCLAQFSQVEYNNGMSSAAPYILLGGVVEQIVSGNIGVSDKTQYLHLGGSAWFKMFSNGSHMDKDHSTPHIPISVTGGDFDSFYLSGMFRPSVTPKADNAECYISGGRFGEVAGAGQEQINGNVTWMIDHADIENFYGGGVNSEKPVTGNINTIIKNSHVGEFCGGPKFGDMTTGKTVTTNATNCTFGAYYGAGYGGTSLYRYGHENKYDALNYNFNQWAYNHYKRSYNSTYKGIATSYEYELIPKSGFTNDENVGRFYVNYASVSLARTHNVTSTLTGCTIEGDFYGGGNLGQVDGDVTSTLTDCTVTGNVYGAGFAATAPTVDVLPKPTVNTNEDNITGAGYIIRPWYNGTAGTYTIGVTPDPVTYTWHYTTETVAAGSEFDDSNGHHYILTNVNFPAEGGTVTGNVTLNITGSDTDITGDVYGGGALASSNTDQYKETSPVTATKTTVNLLGGKITGDVYGGGQGRLVSDDETAVAALVGNTQVNLNGLSATECDAETASSWGLEKESDADDSPWISSTGCIVTGTDKGRIFGCNNLNGTPKGTVTVHVYKTNGAARTTQANLDAIDDSKHRYHLAAVYGGGNLAAYEPTKAVSGTDAEKKATFANVIIDGCDRTSIRTVYGGGNAASTPATQVDIYGTYEIEEVFGGGNGKDPIPQGSGTIENPGANVGYYNYATYNETTRKWEDNENADTKAKRLESSYVYGSGEANVNIYGGRIHRVFGGSNTKGNVRIVAVTMLDNEDNPCEFVVDEAYGGGKSAEMDGAANLIMACIPGLKAAYGGAEEADINGDVNLTITNGSFDRVFGGNNVTGSIGGTITVNIEETGCKPIIIGQLYGGGNQAPYTGQKVKVTDEATGEETEEQLGPTLNVRSFTSIGEVYGGGYGKTAVVTGDTHVNINVSEGKYMYTDENGDDNVFPDAIREINYTEFQRNDQGGFVLDDEGNRIELKKSTGLRMPGHAKGAIGAIYNVYGGGNAADVIGNTFVNIGTAVGDQQVFATPTDATEAERTKAVKGADIRGNVYGGGNAANVSGNTNVKIGR